MFETAVQCFFVGRSIADAMNEKRNLIKALKSTPWSKWQKAALDSLSEPSVVFAGERQTDGKVTADDLLRIYRIRLDSAEKKKIIAYGLNELLKSLSCCSPDSNIEVQPFLGASVSVVAFWRVDTLIGCVTIHRGSLP